MNTPAIAFSPDESSTARTISQPVFHRRVQVNGLSIFYREAGSPDHPTLLLHGLPTSSHLFRHLLVSLAGRFHLVGSRPAGLRLQRHPCARELRLHL